MTGLNPNNFRFNMSIETYNILLQIRDQYLSIAIIPASITRLVVKTQQIEKTYIEDCHINQPFFGSQ
jgi:hypothetical protein